MASQKHGQSIMYSEPRTAREVSTFEKLTRILAYARPQWPMLVGIVVATAAGSIVGVLQPWPIKLLVDNVLGNVAPPGAMADIGLSTSREAILVLLTAGTLVLFALNSGLDAFTSWAWTVAGRRVVYRLAEDNFGRLQRRSLSYHGRTPVGETVTLIT